MKIVFFGLEQAEQDIFLKSFPSEDISFLEGKLDESNTGKAKDAEIVCIFVNSTINKIVIDALPKLKFLATRSTGLNHIDCDYAKKKGIQIAVFQTTYHHMQFFHRTPPH